MTFDDYDFDDPRTGGIDEPDPQEHLDAEPGELDEVLHIEAAIADVDLAVVAVIDDGDDLHGNPAHEQLPDGGEVWRAVAAPGPSRGTGDRIIVNRVGS
jgi:hypothetical protein